MATIIGLEREIKKYKLELTYLRSAKEALKFAYEKIEIGNISLSNCKNLAITYKSEGEAIFSEPIGEIMNVNVAKAKTEIATAIGKVVAKIEDTKKTINSLNNALAEAIKKQEELNELAKNGPKTTYVPGSERL